MLVIHVIDGNPVDGKLVFEVNGNPNSGASEAEKRWPVQWIVRQSNGNPVARITSIKMKTGPNAPQSTDIFAGDGRRPRSHAGGINWDAKVASNAQDFAEYHYDIGWVPKNSTAILTHDPLISIRPRKWRPWEMGALLGLLGLTLLVLGRKKKKPRRQGQF